MSPSPNGNQRLLAALLAATVAASPGLHAQQRADTAFAPPVARPAFPEGRGPLVLLDEAHFNFHTLEGRYSPFARLLRQDGFVVRANRAPFSRESLREAHVLVIANAYVDQDAWVLPAPPAFTPTEVRAVAAWVREGGSLLFIADHMPFPGVADSLAAAFGLAFYDGFAFSLPDSSGRIVFRRSDGSLEGHPLSEGRDQSERVDSVVSFTGQAFRPIRTVSALLTLGPGVVLLLPERAWEFHPTTPRVSAQGLLQGAVFRHGRGRVAAFGEAAMFSAQLAGGTGAPMGMNDPRAGGNPQFLLNTIRWLSGVLEPDPSGDDPR